VTLVDADIYQALRAANVPEELAAKAAAAVRDRPRFGLPPVLHGVLFALAAVAVGLALGWVLPSGVSVWAPSTTSADSSRGSMGVPPSLGTITSVP
jgi:hypothetical protein